MRSNITLDSRLIERIQKETGCKTKSKAVLMVIEDYLLWKQVKKIKNYKGKLKFKDDTATARKKSRNLHRH